MSIVLDGKAAAATIKENLKNKIQELPTLLHLAIIHFNEPSSLSYLRGRKKIAEELNVIIHEFVFSPSCTESELINTIEKLNNDKSIHGIMIDRPLPIQIDENKILNSINFQKDVDGYTSKNLGKMLANQKCFMSCTPGAAIRLLSFYNISLCGKNVLVIGRSLNVGKPLSLMLLNQNATVTIAHSKTKNLKELTKKADIICLAIGKANFLSIKDVNKDVVIVDIGINYDENGKICGDANKDIYGQVAAYSPVPGGVGVLTNVVLMENLYQAYMENNHE